MRLETVPQRRQALQAAVFRWQAAKRATACVCKAHHRNCHMSYLLLGDRVQTGLKTQILHRSAGAEIREANACPACQTLKVLMTYNTV